MTTWHGVPKEVIAQSILIGGAMLIYYLSEWLQARRRRRRKKGDS